MDTTIIIVGDARLARSAELEHLLCDRFEVEVHNGGDLDEVAELIRAARGPVSLLGISAGASLALEAAGSFAIDRIALCEPLLSYGRVELVQQPTLLVSCEEGGERTRRTARTLWRLLPDCQFLELACDEADPFVLADLFEDFFATPAMAFAGGGQPAGIRP